MQTGMAAIEDNLNAAAVSQQSFETLLHAHRGILFKIANTYCWRSEDRADLAQEIVAQLWRAWPSYNPTRTFTTWMYRVALNVAISFVRRESKRNHLSISLDEGFNESLAAPSADTEPDERIERVERLQRFIRNQPSLDRALLLLFLEERPHKEIAEILGITPTNVSTKINRLKQRIRAEV
jgi:RNA polymerase sigma-70 factor (ECF subfamily)